MKFSEQEKEDWDELIKNVNEKKMDNIRRLFTDGTNLIAYATMMATFAKMIHDNAESEEEACMVSSHIEKMMHVTLHALYAQDEKNEDPNYSAATH